MFTRVSSVGLLLALACMGGDEDDDEDRDRPRARDTQEDCDTGDSGSCGEDAVSPLVQEYRYTCDGDTCTWTVLSDGAVGVVELTMIETGDPGYTEPCDERDVGRGGLVCGVWAEYHNDFRLSELENAYGGETKEIELSVVTGWEDQAANASTLFDMDNGSIEANVTFEISISGEFGDYADCVQNGHDPGFFDCPNEF